MSDTPTRHVTVTIRPKVGLRDPEGNAIEHALAALGWQGVTNVHVGRTVSFELPAGDDDTARSEAAEMCSRILANPVIEDFQIEVGGGGA